MTVASPQISALHCKRSLSYPYGSFRIVRRIAPTEEDGGRRRPKPNPPPRPTSSAASAITMVAQMGVPPLPELLELVGVVVCPVVVAVAAGVEVGVAAAPELTVKVNAPSSGSPSRAETVIQWTM